MMDPLSEETENPAWEPARIQCADGTVLAGQWVLPGGEEPVNPVNPVSKAVVLHPVGAHGMLATQPEEPVEAW